MRLRDKVECTALDGLEREGPHPPPRNNLVPRALQFDREILTVDTYRPLYSPYSVGKPSVPRAR